MESDSDSGDDFQIVDYPETTHGGVEDPAKVVEDPAKVVEDPAEVVEHPAKVVEDPAKIPETTVVTPVDTDDAHGLADAKRPVVCVLCHDSYPADAKEDHREGCQGRIVECVCGFRLSRRALTHGAHSTRFCRLRPRSCLQCGEQVTREALGEHLRECPGRTVSCDHCSWRMLARDLARHDCPRRPVPCSLCGTVVPWDELFNHVTTVCDGRMVGCEFCSKGMTHRQLTDHMRVCPHRPVPCPRCLGQVPYVGLRRHTTTECPDRVVDCGWGGCPARMPFRDLAPHMAGCSYRAITCGLCHETVPSLQLVRHLTLCPERPVPCAYCGCSVRFHALASHSEQCSVSRAEYRDLERQFEELKALERDLQEKIVTDTTIATAITRLLKPPNFRGLISQQKCREAFNEEKRTNRILTHLIALQDEEEFRVVSDWFRVVATDSAVLEKRKDRVVDNLIQIRQRFKALRDQDSDDPYASLKPLREDVAYP